MIPAPGISTRRAGGKLTALNACGAQGARGRLDALRSRGAQRARAELIDIEKRFRRVIPAGGGNRRSMLVSWFRGHQAPQARSAVSLPGGRWAVIPAGGGNRFSMLDSPSGSKLTAFRA